MKLTDEEIIKLANDTLNIWPDEDEALDFAHAIADLQREEDAGICDLLGTYNDGCDCAAAIRASKGERHD